MEPIFFVMAIMGCGDAGDACREARIEPVRYTSIQACRADATAALQRNSDVDFPVVTASCRSTTPQMAVTRIPSRG